MKNEPGKHFSRVGFNLSTHNYIEVGYMTSIHTENHFLTETLIESRSRTPQDTGHLDFMMLPQKIYLCSSQRRLQGVYSPTQNLSFLPALSFLCQKVKLSAGSIVIVCFSFLSLQMCTVCKCFTICCLYSLGTPSAAVYMRTVLNKVE
jgi:hypothetical protein